MHLKNSMHNLPLQPGSIYTVSLVMCVYHLLSHKLTSYMNPSCPEFKICHLSIQNKRLLVNRWSLHTIVNTHIVICLYHFFVVKTQLFLPVDFNWLLLFLPYAYSNVKQRNWSVEKVSHKNILPGKMCRRLSMPSSSESSNGLYAASNDMH